MRVGVLAGALFALNRRSPDHAEQAHGRGAYPLLRFAFLDLRRHVGPMRRDHLSRWSRPTELARVESRLSKLETGRDAA
jgi:hypothetical protein